MPELEKWARDVCGAGGGVDSVAQPRVDGTLGKRRPKGMLMMTVVGTKKVKEKIWGSQTWGRRRQSPSGVASFEQENG